MGRYDVLVPGGTYTVTLTFAERPEIRPGERVFGVRLQGKPVLEHLDLARDHRQPPAKFIFRGVDDPEGHILIDFVRERGEPAIAAIEIEGTTKVGSTPYARRINCGGSAMGDFEADQLAGSPRPPDDRAMPVGDFYRDFATANFGAGPAPAIGPILAAIDGVKLPRPANWIDGPGDILRNPDPWSTVARAYDFVGQLEQLRGTVRGAANLDRFDYWLNQFRGLRLMGELGCTAAALDQAVNACRSQSDPEARRQGAETRALPLRIHLAELWTQLMRVEVAGVSSPGELGTIANLEQRSRRHQQLLGKDDEALVTMLRHPLPAAAAPAGTYAGPPRIVVPSVRTSASAGESIALKVILVAAQPPLGAELWWRPAGSRDYQRAPLHPVDRWVYTVTLPAPAPSSPIIEYHIAAQLDGQKERWPISDRGMDQTVVMLEPGI